MSESESGSGGADAAMSKAQFTFDATERDDSKSNSESNPEAGETKYGAHSSPGLRWSARTGVSISDHARERWDERIPDTSVDIEHAWEHGQTVPEGFYGFFRGRGYYPHEVRTYREDEDACDERYQAVLICRHEVIVTVLVASLMDSPERAFLRELWFSRGGERRE